MGARRKIDHEAASLSEVAPGRAQMARLADPGAAIGPIASPVHDQFWRIQASYAAEPAVVLFPQPMRIAIMVGAPAALWAIVIVAVGAVAHAIAA